MDKSSVRCYGTSRTDFSLLICPKRQVMFNKLNQSKTVPLLGTYLFPLEFQVTKISTSVPKRDQQNVLSWRSQRISQAIIPDATFEGMCILNDMLFQSLHPHPQSKSYLPMNKPILNDADDEIEMQNWYIRAHDPVSPHDHSIPYSI